MKYPRHQRLELLVKHWDAALGMTAIVLLAGAIAWFSQRSPSEARQVRLRKIDGLPPGAVFVLVDPQDVYDGDTAKVMFDGRYQKVRFCGIDAPEIGQGATGIAARDELRSLVVAAGDRIWLVPNGEQTYGRIVGELWGDLGAGSVNFGAELLSQGLVFYSSKYAPGCPSFANLRSISETYVPPTVEEPWVWRKTNKK